MRQKLFNGIKRLFRLPEPLRLAYAKSGLDYFFPKFNLTGTLKSIAPESSSYEIHQIVRSTAHDPVLLELKRLRSQANGMLSDHELDLVHSMVLLCKPEMILETGVANGSSSAALLSALNKNNKGKLISIDLPSVMVGDKIECLSGSYTFQLGETSTVPDFDQVGWLVPDSLKERWSLRLGDSLTLMPEILGTSGGIDLFLHDSLHSYSHMKSEFELVWPHLNPGGFLLADDIFVLEHTAISDFAQSVGKPFFTYSGLGIIVK